MPAQLLGTDHLDAGVHKGVQDANVLGQAVYDNVWNPGIVWRAVVRLGSQ